MRKHNLVSERKEELRRIWESVFRSTLYESVVLEDKTSMIKKLALPDISDQAEKDNYKKDLIDFFKSHSSYENKIDWNRFRTLTRSDFDALIKSAENSKTQQKKQQKAEIASNIRSIFKSEGDKKFAVVGETDRWLFVAPLTYEAAVYCDSSENQGAGAKWCIGYEKDDQYWYNYVKSECSTFVMAFNKHYKNLSKDWLETDLKYMIQKDKQGEYHVWNQADEDIGSNLEVFGIQKEIADTMFDRASDLLWKEQKMSIIKVDGKIFMRDSGRFNCSEAGLTSFKGCPAEIDGDFDCSENQLTSFDGAPSSVTGDFNCCYNQLTSLKGCPSRIGGDFDCSENRLVSLEGGPQEVNGWFDCRYNRLTSLKGCQSRINGGFDCCHNLLTSLEGGPSEVNGYFDCRYNQLTSLKGAPSRVAGNLYCRRCNDSLSDKQIADYEAFLKMSPEEQRAAGLLDATGHYKPKD